MIGMTSLDKSLVVVIADMIWLTESFKGLEEDLPGFTVDKAVPADIGAVMKPAPWSDKEDAKMNSTY